MNGENASSPMPNQSINVWAAASSGEKTVHYVVRHPWQWVMDDLVKDDNNMIPVENANNLPLAKQQQQQSSSESDSNSPPGSRRNRRNARNRRGGNESQGRASLRLEVVDNATGHVVLAAHGTSGCFEGLGDKDELVRTIQRCRCEAQNLSPPSLLIQWDVNNEECHNVVGSKLPTLQNKNSNKPPSSVAVLKEPMGSQGKGIYFVRNAEEIHAIIDENHRRVSEDPNLLENLIAAKGRIPAWVLQADVHPALLIRDHRKFHIRSYLVVVERPDDEVLDMLIYARHEVRIAGRSVEDEKEGERDPLAHITNGALSGTTARGLLNNEPELMRRGLQQKVELFIAEIFGKYLLSDISRRIPPPPAPGQQQHPIREFSLAGLDLMVTEDLRLYLLEANVNPAAPGQSLCDEAFSEHLRGFFKDLVNLVTVESRANFHDAFEILERHERA